MEIKKNISEEDLVEGDCSIQSFQSEFQNPKQNNLSLW
jgi:hypothetical protein